eukprot:9502264-Pyramimonas_sp.AAC.1
MNCEEVVRDSAIWEYIARKYPAGAAVVVNWGPRALFEPRDFPGFKHNASSGGGTSHRKNTTAVTGVGDQQ